MRDTIDKMVEDRMELTLNWIADLVDFRVIELASEVQEKLSNMRSLSADLPYSLTTGPIEIR